MTDINQSLRAVSLTTGSCVRAVCCCFTIVILFLHCVLTVGRFISRATGILISEIMIIVFGIVATSLALAYGGDIADNPYLGAEVAFLVVFAIAFVAFIFEAYNVFGAPVRSVTNATANAAGVATDITGGTLNALTNIGTTAVKTAVTVPVAVGTSILSPR